VSKRKDSLYRSGRSKDWLKMKNPACEAVKSEAEEDCGSDDDAIDAACHSHANAWELPESFPYSSSDFGTERRSLMPSVPRGKYMGCGLERGRRARPSIHSLSGLRRLDRLP
jgi:hypothetical protein